MKARGKRKSYWNFSEWSWRPASIGVPGPQPLDRVGEDVLGGVADDLAALGVLAVTMRERGVLDERRAQVDQLAVELAGDGVAGEPRADRARRRRAAWSPDGTRASAAVGQA